jgi:hypothetical protein
MEMKPPNVKAPTSMPFMIIKPDKKQKSRSNSANSIL